MPAERRSRDQFRTKLACGRCGAKGDAVWEESSDITGQSSIGDLVSLSDGFIQRMRKNHQGQPEIACAKCGQVQGE